MKYLLMPVLLMGLFFSSCELDPCSSKRFFIYSHEKLIEGVKDRSDNFTDKDWVRKEEKMDMMARDCYPKYAGEMTNEERKDFWINYIHFNIKRHGRDFFRELERDSKDWPDSMDEDIGIVLDDPEADLKILLSEVYGEDINEAIDEVLLELEKIGDRIKEWLEQD